MGSIYQMWTFIVTQHGCITLRPKLIKVSTSYMLLPTSLHSEQSRDDHRHNDCHNLTIIKASGSAPRNWQPSPRLWLHLAICWTAQLYSIHFCIEQTCTLHSMSGKVMTLANITTRIPTTMPSCPASMPFWAIQERPRVWQQCRVESTV